MTNPKQPPQTNLKNAPESIKPDLNLAELYPRLLDGDKHLSLVKYIFRTLGTAPGRINFRKAAEELNVDKNTVSRYVGELIKRNILLLDENKNIRINENLVR